MSEIGDLKKHWTLNRVILPRSGIFRGEAVTITLTGAPAFSKAVLCLESQRGGCKYVQRLICEMLRYPRNNIFLKVEGFCLAMQHYFCCCRGSNFVRTFSDVLMMPVRPSSSQWRTSAKMQYPESLSISKAGVSSPSIVPSLVPAFDVWCLMVWSHCFPRIFCFGFQATRFAIRRKSVSKVCLLKVDILHGKFWAKVLVANISYAIKHLGEATRWSRCRKTAPSSWLWSRWEPGESSHHSMVTSLFFHSFSADYC